MSPVVPRLLALPLALAGPAITSAPVLAHGGAALRGVEWPLLVLHGLLVVGALLAQVPRFELNLLGRSTLWALLGWLALASVLGGGSGDPKPATWAVGLGLAQLALLADPVEALPGGGRFGASPARGPLVAVLALAVADTVALGFWGLVFTAERGALGLGVLAAALLMAVTVFGLLRLRTWAFALNVAANLLIAAGAWLLPGAPDGFAWALGATAALQLVAGVPLSLALLRGRPPRRSQRLRLGFSALVIALATLAPLVAAAG